MSDNMLTQQDAIEIAQRFVEDIETDRKRRFAGTRSGDVDWTYIFQMIEPSDDGWLVHFEITSLKGASDPSDRIVLVNKTTGEASMIRLL